MRIDQLVALVALVALVVPLVAFSADIWSESDSSRLLESARINAGPILKILAPILSLLTVTTVTSVTTVAAGSTNLVYCLTGLSSSDVATIQAAQNACQLSQARSLTEEPVEENEIEHLPPRGSHVAATSIASSMSGVAGFVEGARIFFGPLFTLTQTSVSVSFTTKTVAFTDTTSWYCIYTYLTFC